MALDATTLVTAMTAAGQTLGKALWKDMQTYTIPELNKIAIQILAIEEAMLKKPAPFTQDGATALLNMQITASIGVVVAMTTLTMLAVQTALNTILAAVKTMVNTAIGFALIA
jgi:hypothetical protein